MLEIWNLINEMSPYLLLGFLFAGILHAFVPPVLYQRFLGRNNFKSVLWAAILGIPLPLCSCGVIPTAMSLRKEGASKGATTSFLIATPQTGIDSILATASILGIPFAIIRPIAALVTALIGGEAVNLATSKEPKEEKKTKACAGDSCATSHSNSFWHKCVEALRYGFVEMLQDIGKWLVLGLVIAGIITVLVPDDFFSQYVNTPILGMLVVLALSVPMYICATGSIPIAAALILKGLTPGAGLVLLMAGPASNMASILVINKVMGKRTLYVYLASIILGSILFGLGIDYLLPAEWFTSHLALNHADCHESISWFHILCTVVLGLLLCYGLYEHLHGKKHSHSHVVMSADARVFKVEGMTCNHCCEHVEKAIRGVEGVEQVDVHLANGTATVEGSASDEAIIAAITHTGYTATKQ